MKSKPEQPSIAFFAAQLNALLVGPGNRFATFDDLCKFAAQECGITGVSMPSGMLNVRRMINDDSHRAEVVAHYAGLGTPIIGIETHIVGQRVCMHPAVVPRFVGFAPKWMQHCGVADLEAQARDEMLEAIELGRLLGIRRHQTFPGGRSVPVATDPWNAHPPLLREKALALLAVKWEPILKAAGRGGVRVGFEIRHIMEDLFSWRDLRDLRNKYLLDVVARNAFAWGVDVSHHEIDGDDPTEDVLECIKLGLAEPGHAKQGDFNSKKPGACRRPANMAWADRAGQFRTFGTVHPDHSRLFADVVLKAHERSAHGEFAVIEGECMAIRNPEQGLRVAAENLRLVFAGKEPVSLQEITLEPWDGPAFDKFADSGYTAEAVMALSGNDAKEVNRRLEHAGDI